MGLPDLHRLADGPRHHRNLFQVITAIGHGRRDGVVLALVAPRFLVERLQDDLHLLQEQLPVGVVVDDGRAESLHLTGMVAPPDAEDHAPAGQDVRHGEVLGDAQRMPHGYDVESLPEFQVFGLPGQVDPHEDQVGNALVALVLEVVLGHPHAVEAALIHVLGQRLGMLVSLRQLLVGVATLVGRRAVRAHVVQVDLPHVQNRKPLNHPAHAPL